jgi:ATP-dependent RNA helicase RhlE
MPFTQLGLDQRILKAIQEAGYTEPTPIQAAAIPAVISGGDVIGIAQTGTGKTAAFTLPILSLLASAPALPAGVKKKTRVLVLAPTRELVAQIEENVMAYAKHMPLRIAKVFGGVGERPQIEALKSGADIVIATPGRLLDLMGQGAADFSGVKHLVLDEADRMLDMGFLPDMRRIVKTLPFKRQSLLFSATLSKEIEALTNEFQQKPKLVQIGKRSNPAETVKQFVYEVPRHLKLDLLKHLLTKDNEFEMVLVFTRTKHGADRVAKKLEKDADIRCATLHANRSQAQRLKALADFKSWKVRVLVATDIVARGIDVDGISHVVNFDFPMHAEDYVHRIGRTGRAQAIGDAISFASPEDMTYLRSLEKFIGRGITRKRAEGFNYNVPAPAVPDQPDSRERGRRSQPQGNKNQENRPSEKRRFDEGGGGGKPGPHRGGRPQGGGGRPQGGGGGGQSRGEGRSRW